MILARPDAPLLISNDLREDKCSLMERVFLPLRVICFVHTRTRADRQTYVRTSMNELA